MIQYNNNLSVLPFYTYIDEQARNRSYAYGEDYPLYTPMGTVPPFQIIMAHGGGTVTAATLMKADGTAVGSILSALTSGGMTKQSYADDGYDVVVFPSASPNGITSAEGKYYIQMTIGGTVYYSDIFTVVGRTGGFLCVQWYDVEDLVMDAGRIVYRNGASQYRNTLWLCTELGKPEYTFNEEGETRDGYFFPEKMVSEKTYKFCILASEYLCDIMRFIRLSDFVFVRDQYGNDYRCDTFLMTPKWEAQGNMASVEVEFTCDTVAKKVGRGATGASGSISPNNGGN